MNTQDRAVVKALLQYMTERHLTGSEEFRAAIKHFNVTTAHTGQMVSDDCAKFFASENNYFVDVFTPDTIDNHPHGLRTTSDSKAEAEAYAADASARGDEPVNTRVLDARAYIATARQLREEQEEVAAKEQLDEWANTHDSRKTPAQWIEIDHAEALEMNAMRNGMKGCKAMGDYLKREAAHAETLEIEMLDADAITVTEALALFVDRYVVLDAQAVGKRYIVAIPSCCHEGKLIKHGTYNTRPEAQTALNNLPNTCGITRGQLVVLNAQ